MRDYDRKRNYVDDNEWQAYLNESPEQTDDRIECARIYCETNQHLRALMDAAGEIN